MATGVNIEHLREHESIEKEGSVTVQKTSSQTNVPTSLSFYIKILS